MVGRRKGKDMKTTTAKYAMGTILSLWLLSACAHKPSTVWKDSKNGYFSFVPPKGWTVETYSDPRTKIALIAFRHPQNKSIFVRIIVREAPGETFDEMKQSADEAAAQYRTQGFKCVVERTECHGVPATITTADLGSTGYTKLLRFLQAGLHFNVQWAAPTKDLLDINQDVIDKSIASIVANGPEKPNTEKALAHRAASYLRQAEIVMERGDKQTAQAILIEGNRLYPESSDIKKKMAEYGTPADAHR
jgi:hypothetical protein